ncbi:sensor histidine kinase [Roseovarius arcticus]|uniref:sensor histidine kinase n=1 Tax=Roseovarius arcticus TaxID=2547404 RepID=UPI0011108467|nr:HAMP domain-containing sensor histidine kinase [Roseovarius arcticus]
MIKAGSALRIALALLCLAAVLLGGTVIWKLSDRVYQIRTAEQSDPLWIASKLQFELLNFNAELAEYAIGARSAEEVATRFDILWSRLNVMQEGKMAEIISEANIDQAALVEFERVLEKVDPLVQSLPESDILGLDRQVAAREILVEIDPYNLKFNQLSLSMAQERSRILSEFRNGLLSLSNAIAYLGIVIVALASIVVIILIADLRLSRRKSQQLQKLVLEVEASSKMKDNFMIVVSHELRTPLTSIVGGISLFKAKFGKGLDEGATKLIDIAHRNSERLLSLVNDILDAQSLSEGKINLKKECMNLNSVIVATAEECEVYASELGVKFSVAQPGAEVIVSADEARISQVISNLLSNAAKFSHAGGIVDISARQTGSWIRVEVTDYGKGMLRADQENLFSRFHQINPGTTTARKSSGLGLSITKNIIELHGGKVGVNSIEGEGSTFWFTLPSANAPKSK